MLVKVPVRSENTPSLAIGQLLRTCMYSVNSVTDDQSHLSFNGKGWVGTKG